jgi:hypothetical protein
MYSHSQARVSADSRHPIQSCWLWRSAQMARERFAKSLCVGSTHLRLHLLKRLQTRSTCLYSRQLVDAKGIVYEWSLLRPTLGRAIASIQLD